MFRHVPFCHIAGLRFLPIADGFRMIVLANRQGTSMMPQSAESRPYPPMCIARPGFPFLGNDFYRVCGDVFGAVLSRYPIRHPPKPSLSSEEPRDAEIVMPWNAWTRRASWSSSGKLRHECRRRLVGLSVTSITRNMPESRAGTS